VGRIGRACESEAPSVQEAFISKTPETFVILLDTHALLFLISAPQRLSKAAARAIIHAEKGKGLAIASITLWEVALLIDARRISVAGSTESFLKQIAGRRGISILDLTPEVAALAFQFPPDFPNDPADRIIAATARVHGLPLITKDQRLQDSSLLKTIW
jgi:PIN domain nuclease of toxin-antitoxin system